MRWFVVFTCALVLGVGLGCSDTKTEEPKNPTPPPTKGPAGASPDAKSGHKEAAPPLAP